MMLFYRPKPHTMGCYQLKHIIVLALPAVAIKTAGGLL